MFFVWCLVFASMACSFFCALCVVYFRVNGGTDGMAGFGWNVVKLYALPAVVVVFAVGVLVMLSCALGVVCGHLVKSFRRGYRAALED